MGLDRKQYLAITGIAAALFGLLVLPFLFQEVYGISAVKVTFAVIAFYAAVSWYINNR